MRFTILPEEEVRIDEWLDSHNKKCPYYDDGSKPVSPQGAIGGRLTYCFTPNGIGQVVKIRCACGGVIDVTDYESW